MIGGDFNTHHPLWNPSEYTRHDEEADILVAMMMEFQLNLLLPPGTITYSGGGITGTAIDLVWGNDEAANRIITCRITEEHDHGSDHLPIETTIDLQITLPQPIPSYNYTKTNWEELKNKLRQYLPDLSRLSPINLKMITRADVDRFSEDLIEAIL
jgi:hypothetical protein